MVILATFAAAVMCTPAATRARPAIVASHPLFDGTVRPLRVVATAANVYVAGDVQRMTEDGLSERVPVFVSRLDHDGNILWQITLNEAGRASAKALSPAPGGGVWVAGRDQLET